MTDTITLTREQWDEIFGGLDEIRDAATDGGFLDIAEALDALGLAKAAATIDAVQNQIADQSIRLQAILIGAEEAQPAPAKPRAMPKWLWPLNNRKGRP